MMIYSVMLLKTEEEEAQKQRPHLPVELFTCVVICLFWSACDNLVESLRLSWFMFSKQVSALRAGWAEEAAPFWCRALLWKAERGLDKVTEVLKVLRGSNCPDRWDIFSVAFPWDLCVESTWLFDTAGCLVGFEILFWVLRRALPTLFSGWTAWAPGCDFGCWFWLVAELLGWVRLKGTGLVHGFFFLAFPWSEMTKS